MHPDQTTPPPNYREVQRRDQEDEHVFVAVIDHDHGSETSVHLTHEGAVEFVHGYVTEWWDQEINAGLFPDEDEVRPIPTDAMEAIEAYFDAVEDEWYRIERVLLRL